MIVKLTEELIDYLAADLAVSTIVSERVYAGLIRQGDNIGLACLVLAQVTAPSPRYLNGKVSLIESRWQIDCYGGDSYATAVALASAVDAALVDSFTGLATIGVQQCVRDGGPTDLSAQDGDKVIRRISLDYTIFYEDK